MSLIFFAEIFIELLPRRSAGALFRISTKKQSAHTADTAATQKVSGDISSIRRNPMKLLKWHSNTVERMRLALGWSQYTLYWVSFIKGVAVTCLVIWLMC